MPKWQCLRVQRSFVPMSLPELKSRLAEVLEILLQPKSQLAFSKVILRTQCGRPDHQKGRPR